MNAKQLTKPQTGIASVDRHLALLADTVNPVLRSVAQAGTRQLLPAFSVTVPTDWVNVISFLNSFTQYTTGGNYQVRYRKSGDGAEVVIEGMVNIPAGPPGPRVGIYQLPSAYLPDTASDADVIVGTQSQDAGSQFRVSPTGLVETGFATLTAGNWYELRGRFTAKDRTPIVPSCFPVPVPHSLSSPPTAVIIASCVDASNPAAPPAWPALSVQWETTPGAQNSITVLNIPGLLPTHTYSIQLMAFA